MPQLSKQDTRKNFSELFARLDRLIISFSKKRKQQLLMLGTQVQRLEERVVKLESKQ